MPRSCAAPGPIISSWCSGARALRSSMRPSSRRERAARPRRPSCPRWTSSRIRLRARCLSGESPAARPVPARQRVGARSGSRIEGGSSACSGVARVMALPATATGQYRATRTRAIPRVRASRWALASRWVPAVQMRSWPRSRSADARIGRASLRGQPDPARAAAAVAARVEARVRRAFGDRAHAGGPTGGARGDPGRHRHLAAPAGRLAGWCATHPRGCRRGGRRRAVARPFAARCPGAGVHGSADRACRIDGTSTSTWSCSAAAAGRRTRSGS